MPLLLVLFSPFCKPRYAFALSAPVPRRTARSFYHPNTADLLYRASTRYPDRFWDNGGNNPPPEEEKPLTPWEKFLWIGFAVWVTLTFLAMFVIIAFAHSPYNAN